jgi:serine phosphatase RsbU (regulator of sigma subunit)
MAAMRASVRAFMSVDAAPAAMLDHLQKMFTLLSITELVSLVYAVIDPTSASVDLVNAGHCPPVIVGNGGSGAFAATPARRPLGTDRDVCRSTTFPFHPGDVLLLYSDGLVERRKEHIDIGLDRVRDSASMLGAADLDAALHTLVTDVLGAGGNDDVTALAVRAVSDAAV